MIKASVAITQSQDIVRAIAQALERMPLETFVGGKLVAVKPNRTTPVHPPRTPPA